MRKGVLSNLLRSLGLSHFVDRIRYYLERQKLKEKNKIFSRDHPSIVLPPDYLMYESFKLDYNNYYFGGQKTAQWIYNSLLPHHDIKNAKILDWGCGPGRIIRHLNEVMGDANKLFGTDYNEESIIWCRNNISNVDFNLNKLEAILPYPDDFFDVIYGISIFTHLSEEMHFEWYRELRRILKPGGIILLTTQGDNFKKKMTKSEILKYENGNLIVRGKVKEGHRTFSAFHPDAFMKEIFTKDEILEKIVIDPKAKDYVPQDTWLVRKQ